MSSGTPQRPQGIYNFTVRSVYCCNVCGLEFDLEEAVVQHLEDHHAAAESDDVCVEEDTSPVQQKNDFPPSSLLPPGQLKQSDEQCVSQTGSVRSLVCLVCSRTYKYLRCFERHIKQHRNSARLASAEAGDGLQCENALQVSSGTVCLLKCEPDSENRGVADGPTDNAVNDERLQEVTETSNGVFVGVLDENKKSVKEVCISHASPYCCAECPLRFKTLLAFRRHTTEKHIGWTFVCKLCGQLFTESHELHSHVIDHHREIPSCDDIEPMTPVHISHRCKKCGLYYLTEEELMKHAASHTNNFPAFACSMCSRRYLTKSGLKVHKWRVHSGDYPYLCDLCGDRFATGEEKCVHAKQHASDLCTNCGIRLRHRSVSGSATCTVCCFEQVSINGAASTVATKQQHPETSLRSYKCRNSKTQRFQCSQCSRVFTEAFKLRKHILCHVEPPKSRQRSYACELCGRKFLWKRSLEVHLRRAHHLLSASLVAAEASALASSQCSSSVTLPASLDAVDAADSPRDHAQSKSLQKSGSHQNPDEGTTAQSAGEVLSDRKDKRLSFLCPECGAAFFWRSNVLRHMREEHQRSCTSSGACGHSQSLKYHCSRCGRRFSRLRYLRAHVRAHDNAEKDGDVAAKENGHADIDGGRSEPMLCSQCGQKLKGVRELRAHMRRHSGVRPHKCPSCDRSFFILATLREHMSVVHHGLRFVCDRCGHEANSKNALNMHCRAAHPAPGVVPAFRCPVCSRTFWSRPSLERHAEAHDASRSAKRKAMCSVCSLVFRHVYNLAHHVNTTHADVSCATPFACATCRQQFDSGLAFKTHYRSKHRNRGNRSLQNAVLKYSAVQ